MKASFSVPNDALLDRSDFRAVQGRLQRVDYYSKEISVISSGAILRFLADDESLCFFDGQRTILRCFHPLDEVKVIFQESRPNIIKAIYAWEKRLA